MRNQLHNGEIGIVDGWVQKEIRIASGQPERRGYEKSI
jgi:hypothetical protein